MACRSRRNGRESGLVAWGHRDSATQLSQFPCDQPAYVEGKQLTPPVPSSGGDGKINVTPQDIVRAAKAFYTAQNDLYNAWSTLQTALNSNTGMAGDDDPAKSFNTKYAPGVQAAWKALRTS